jgi:acyl carrier protein
MTEGEILEGVRQVIRDSLRPGRPVDEKTRLLGDLELDSLKQLTLVVEIEDRFRIRFDDVDQEGLETVGDVVRLIARRLSEEQPSA